MVVSDHGFSHSAFGVNLTAELIKAGLKASAASDDVVVASSGQTLLLHVKDRDRAHPSGRRVPAGPGLDRRPVHRRPRGGGIAPVEGRARDLRARAHPSRSARARPGHRRHLSWSSAPGQRRAGHRPPPRPGRRPDRSPAGEEIHGSLSPWTVRNTFLAWGVDFKRGATIRTPVSATSTSPDAARPPRARPRRHAAPLRRTRHRRGLRRRPR